MANTTRLRIKLFKSDTSWFRSEQKQPIERLFLDSEEDVIEESTEFTFEKVLIDCAKKCGITPVHLSLFGLKDKKTGRWVNLASTIQSKLREQDPDCNDTSILLDTELELEFRIRFLFSDDVFRQSEENEDKYPVYGKMLIYLFHQHREDFQTGRIKLTEASTEDRDQANLGLAVFDLLRLGREAKLEYQELVSSTELKRLTSRSYNAGVSSKRWLKKTMIKRRFLNYIGELETRYRQPTEFLGDLLDFHRKYVNTLEGLSQFTYAESYDVIPRTEDADECVKLSVGPNREVVKHSKNDSFGSQWCKLSDLADLHIAANDDNERWTVTLVHLSGETLAVDLSLKCEAEGLASCIDGYYNLLVDAHFHLCKAVCRPSLVERLKVSCHGPISASLASRLLKNRPNPMAGDCLLRCSSDEFHAYFITTIFQQTEDGENVIRNYKVTRESNGFVITGAENRPRCETLDILLQEYFDILRLVHPLVKLKCLLLVCRSKQQVTPKRTDVPYISHDAFSYAEKLATGRFADIILHAKKDNPNEFVVFKQIVEQSDLRAVHHIQRSFQNSRIDFRQLNNFMDKVGENKNNHLLQVLGFTMHTNVILEHMPLGSITDYAKTHRELPDPDWLLRILWQLSHACAFMEEKEFAHGNITGKNVLMKRDGMWPSIKLSDPGVTTFWKKNETLSVLEPPWLAYEFRYIDAMATSISPTVNGDKWSFATTVCEISLWRATILPQYETTEEMLPEWLTASRLIAFRDLLVKCWSTCPDNRPSFREILREIGSVIKNFRFDSVEPAGDPAPDQPYSYMAAYADEKLEVIKVLGKGCYGLVELCRYESNGQVEEVAVKSIANAGNPHCNREVFNEIQAMRKVNHRHVAKLKGVTTPFYRLVMEYLKEGDLKSYLTKRKLKGTRLTLLLPHLCRFASQITQGMQALQQLRIIHRDLALRNILLARDAVDDPLYVKISDFGLSRIVGENSSYYHRKPGHALLPMRWFAPECLKDKYDYLYSDVWSFGVTAWEMFSYGEHPNYNVHNEEDLYTLLCDGKRLPKPDECPQKIYDVIRLCWNWKQVRRPGFTKLQKLFDALAVDAAHGALED